MSRETEGRDELDALYRAHRRYLWRLAYRITGDAAEADDVVQEAFARFLAGPPADLGAPLRPWLARVATNLAVDALRRRRRRGYPGAWLPAPVESGDEADVAENRADDASEGPESRYGLRESVSFAFLLALEALTPRQRAVVVLRDVLDYSAREVAAALGASEESVRILHHRARRALAGYDRARCVPDAALAQRTRAALDALMGCLARQDARGLEALLVTDARTVTDAGGEYTALREPMVGRARVVRFLLQAALARRDGRPRVAVRSVNGLPAVVIDLTRPARRQAPRTVLRCELDAEGRIREVHAVLAPRKLVAVRA
ncbi:MAG: sigma-70 family RNA polymerase sigma factor [Thermodesulfobacteriota bacterium]